VHIVSHNRIQPPNSIIVSEWFQQKNVLEKDTENDEEETEFELDGTSVMDRPISEEEVLLAIRRLKHHKAACPDGLSGELKKTTLVMLLSTF